MAQDIDLKKKIDVTKNSIEELGDQIKEMIQSIKAEIDDYRFSVSSTKEGIGIEFFIKASFSKSKSEKN